MALRTPLVINSGQIQQLQAGDTLNAPQAGYTGVSQTNNDSTTHVPGTVAYNNAADGVKRAQANAAGTAYPMGIAVASIVNGTAGIYAVDGILSLTTAQWDAIFGTTGGLTFGTVYYLSPTVAGGGTSVGPTTVGQYVVELGIALSTTELDIRIRQSILL